MQLSVCPSWRVATWRRLAWPCKQLSAINLALWVLWLCACREAVVVAPSVRTPVDQAVESEEEEPPMDPLECVLSLSARCLPAVCPLSARCLPTGAVAAWRSCSSSPTPLSHDGLRVGSDDLVSNMLVFANPRPESLCTCPSLETLSPLRPPPPCRLPVKTTLPCSISAPASVSAPWSPLATSWRCPTTRRLLAQPPQWTLEALRPLTRTPPQAAAVLGATLA